MRAWPHDDEIVEVGCPGVWRLDGRPPRLLVRQGDRGRDCAAIEVAGQRYLRRVDGATVEPLMTFIERVALAAGTAAPFRLRTQ